MIAASAPMSAQAVAAVATFMFKHQSGQSDPSGILRSIGFPSLRDRCRTSHFPGIGDSLVHVPGSGRLQIKDAFEPPRKRIKAFESDLQGSLHSLPGKLTDLRFPEHLLMANSVRVQLLSV